MYQRFSEVPLDFLVAISPVLFITALILIFRTGIILTGFAGLLFTASIVHFYFATTLKVVALSVLDGVLTTLPVILVVYTGILLAEILVSTGSLKRMGGLILGRVHSRLGKAVILSFGLSNILEGMGIIAEPLTAPLCYEEGFSPEDSAILSIWGYSALLTLEFAGIILTVLSFATGISIENLVLPVTLFSIAGSLIMFLLLPFVLEEGEWKKKDMILLTASPLILGLFVSLSVKYITYKMAGVFGGGAVLLFLTLYERTSPLSESRDMGKREKLSPWEWFPYLLILLLFLGINLISPIKKGISEYFTLSLSVVRSHTISVNPLTDIYTYLFLASLCGVLAGGGKVGDIYPFLKKNFPKGSRAAIAMALFGAMGQVISFSGFDPQFSSVTPSSNMAVLIAKGLYRHTGIFYLLFIPLLGWSGTFLTGYGIASIMLFGKLQVSIAPLLGLNPAIAVSVLAVGAGVGSISSPFKVAIATPLCNGVGKEPLILRKTIPAGIVTSLLLGVALFFYRFY